MPETLDRLGARFKQRLKIVDSSSIVDDNEEIWQRWNVFNSMHVFNLSTAKNEPSVLVAAATAACPHLFGAFYFVVLASVP